MSHIVFKIAEMYWHCALSFFCYPHPFNAFIYNILLGIRFLSGHTVFYVICIFGHLKLSPVY